MSNMIIIFTLLALGIIVGYSEGKSRLMAYKNGRYSR